MAKQRGYHPNPPPPQPPLHHSLHEHAHTRAGATQTDIHPVRTHPHTHPPKCALTLPPRTRPETRTHTHTLQMLLCQQPHAYIFITCEGGKASLQDGVVRRGQSLVRLGGGSITAGLVNDERKAGRNSSLSRPLRLLVFVKR